MPGSCDGRELELPYTTISIANSTFDSNSGPNVGIDEGHYNYHTVADRFAPFAELLRKDGFEITALREKISSHTLANLDVLVIANPLHESNHNHWALPTPSAFTTAEIVAIESWVQEGGSLLLIADHFPFPGAIAELAQVFGFTFFNSFVFPNEGPATYDLFQKEKGTLKIHRITCGRNITESVQSVATFTGSAFYAPNSADPLLVFPQEYVALLPIVAWEFPEDTPYLPAAGLLQGAVTEFAKGRVAVFGEAAMFTAQQFPNDSKSDFGFNVPAASENKQFILNLMRWLTRDL